MRDNSPILARVLAYSALVEFVPLFLTGFFAFAMLRYIFHCLKLDNADAIGKEFEKQENYFVQEDIQSIELSANVWLQVDDHDGLSPPSL